jgi:restriction endonuclease S subunit
MLFLYPPGTLLIAMYGATIGRLGILGILACTNQACCAFSHPVALDIKYAFYWLLMRRREIVLMSSGGGQPNVNQEKLRSLKIPAPGLDEQRTIATFLDRETAKIDALIAKKERLIELLQEKRAALISHAVTKGLDPSAPMKDSGVEWLGEIPEHWEVKQLKRLASLRAGYAITSEIIEEVGEYPVFGGNGIRGYTSSYTHEGEFPLIGRQGALCGCVNFAHGRFWASEHAVVVTPKPEVNAYWLTHLLGAMSLNAYSESAAQPGLGVETISSLRMPMPFIAEQHAIAAFLDRETTEIDTLRSKI